MRVPTHAGEAPRVVAERLARALRALGVGARISPKTMARIDAIVEQRRESVTATSKNAIVEELLALALDTLDDQAQAQLPLEGGT